MGFFNNDSGVVWMVGNRERKKFGAKEREHQGRSPKDPSRLIVIFILVFFFRSSPTLHRFKLMRQAHEECNLSGYVQTHC
jgi:hypothetical protein